jgi:hypothetical protein
VRAKELGHILQVLLIAPETVDILNDDDIDLAGTYEAEHVLQAWPLHCRTGYTLIAVKAVQRPAFLVRIATCCGFLILYGGRLALWIVKAQPAIANSDDVTAGGGGVHLFFLQKDVDTRVCQHRERAGAKAASKGFGELAAFAISVATILIFSEKQRPRGVWRAA